MAASLSHAEQVEIISCLLSGLLVRLCFKGLHVVCAGTFVTTTGALRQARYVLTANHWCGPPSVQSPCSATPIHNQRAACSHQGNMHITGSFKD